MSNTPITSLPVALALSGSETVAVVQGGTTKQAAVSLFNLTGSAPGTVQSANTIFSGPSSGGPAYPTFRSLVQDDIAPAGQALTKTDDTNITLTLGGTPTAALISATSLTLGWTGQLAASRGGTGVGSYAVGDLLYASGATALSKLADVATGNALISGGVTTAPLWGKIGLTTHVSGTLPIANGGTGQTTAGTSFDALAPTTTQGDLIYRDSSTNTRLAAGTSGYLLLANGAGANPSWAGFTQSGTGAVAQTWQAKLRNIVTPEDFGCTGDGSTDDSTNFQKALTALGNAGGGTLLAINRYYLAAVVTVPNNVRVLGQLGYPEEYAVTSSTNYYNVLSQLSLGPGVYISMAEATTLENLIIIRSGLSIPATTHVQRQTLIGQFAGTAVFSTTGYQIYLNNLLILGHLQAVSITATGGTQPGRVICRYVRGDNTNGILLDSSGDVCRLDGCHMYPYLTFDPTTTTQQDHMRTGQAYTLQNAMTWPTYVDCFEFGYLYGFYAVNTATVAQGPANVEYLRCQVDHPTTASGTVTMTIASPAVVTWASHGLPVNTPIVFTTTGALPTGVTAGTTYYVYSVTTDTFQISTAVGSGVVNTSGTQSGTHTATPNLSSQQPAFYQRDIYNNPTTVTIDIATPGLVHATAHGFVAGDAVVFATTSALPTGLTAGTTYFVIAAGLTANAFEVSATSGGSAINTSGSQSGVQTCMYAYHGCEYTKWTNCVAHGHNWGIYVQTTQPAGNDTFVVIGSEFICDTGIEMQQGYLIATSNLIQSATTGIRLDANCTGAQIETNRFSGCTTALTNSTSAATMIRGNAGIGSSAGWTSNSTPATSDGAALGTTALQWSDLFLASGGVINWNNGNVTLTHSAGLLTLAGSAFNTSGSAYDSTVNPNMQGTNFEAIGATPTYIFKNTGGTTDQQYMDMYLDATSFNFRFLDHTFGSAGVIFTAVRSGSAVSTISFPSTAPISMAGALSVTGVATVASGTATPAAGSTAARLLFGTTAGFGVYYGSSAPTVSAAQGSLYLRSDGSSTSTRLYVNTNGSTTWTNVTTAT